MAHLSVWLTTLIISFVSPGSVSGVIDILRAGRRMDRFRETAHLLREPWIVEAALARLGNKRLTREEQATVLAATRLPLKVRWPHWWGSG